MESREEQIMEAAFSYIQPVLDASVILAAKYCHATGRTVVSPLDLEFAGKYCAMNALNLHHILGDFNHEDDEDEDEDEDEDDPDFIVNEEDLSFDDEFRKYEGDDELFNEVNRAVEVWNDWEPEFGYEIALKNAINRF